MSRRSGHGAHPHGQRPHRREPPRTDGPARPAIGRTEPAIQPAALILASDAASDAASVPEVEVSPPTNAVAIDPVVAVDLAVAIDPVVAVDLAVTAEPAPPPPSPMIASRGPSVDVAPDRSGGCTTPQLRRFIKSRAWVPMHELRRRFAIDCADDDVTAIETEGRRIFVGLPVREGQMLGELVRSRDVGYELSLDPVTPIVIGVYPMRPVTRN